MNPCLPSPLRPLTLLALLASLSGACYGAPVDDETSETQPLTVSGPVSIPVETALCNSLGRPHTFSTSSLQSLLDLVDYPLQTPSFDVNVDTSTGACLFAPQQVANGYRVGGRFRVTDSLRLHGNLTAQLVAGTGDDADEPYMLQVTASLGDVHFSSVGDLDISYLCLGLDRNLDGVVRDLRVRIFFRPPSTERRQFHFDHVAVDFGEVRVSNPDAVTPNFGPVVGFINGYLAGDEGRQQIESSIESALAPHVPSITQLTPLFDAIFWTGSPYPRATADICAASRVDRALSHAALSARAQGVTPTGRQSWIASPSRTVHRVPGPQLRSSSQIS